MGAVFLSFDFLFKPAIWIAKLFLAEFRWMTFLGTPDYFCGRILL